MMYYSYFYEQKLLQVVSIEKKMQLIALVPPCHSPHKLLDAAHIYLGLTLKHCYMLELF